ncbi:MAG: hypothetical protein JSW70_02265, partial [Syntrophobacterales bacterium]
GDFNSWDVSILPMKKGSQGTWKNTVDLPPGRYEYRFWVDGIWRDNPTVTFKVEKSL